MHRLVTPGTVLRWHRRLAVERLSRLPPGESTSPRPPTAFQDYLDQHHIKYLRSWRAVS